MYMDSFSSFKFMPLPHLNTLPLQKSKPRHAYLVTQLKDNFYIALESSLKKFKIWNLMTG